MFTGFDMVYLWVSISCFYKGMCLIWFYLDHNANPISTELSHFHVMCRQQDCMLLLDRRQHRRKHAPIQLHTVQSQDMFIKSYEISIQSRNTPINIAHYRYHYDLKHLLRGSTPVEGSSRTSSCGWPTWCNHTAWYSTVPTTHPDMTAYTRHDITAAMATLSLLFIPMQ